MNDPAERGSERCLTKALRDEGLGVPDELVGLAPPTRVDARGLALAMLSCDRPPTALVAASDTQALAQTGRRGVERLVDLIEGRPIGSLREVLPVTVIVRSTTAAPSRGAST